MEYTTLNLSNNIWIIHEAGHNPLQPAQAHTFAFDTETQVYLDGVKRTQTDILKELDEVSQEDKRSRLRNEVWSWQAYDELNGFYMTNDFDTWLNYCCLCGYKSGWCYNATFDFAQIDYKLLSCDKWKPHIHTTGSKGQAWTYESLHNNAGARYAYKLWTEYHKHGRKNNRHKHVHSVQLTDFMKLMTGGLANVLEALKVVDNDGVPVRKLSMEYQLVDTQHLTQDDINYCCNDVKGLYFAVKQFNTAIEEQSEGECHIFGKGTNIMTAGGFAKREMLRVMYPEVKQQYRIKRYQSRHPLSIEQDRYIRENHLYRGGICLVNPRYKGKLLTADKYGTMQRYDVNSEYPYAMANIRDLIGQPFRAAYSDYLSMTNKDDYECIMILRNITGEMKAGKLPVWYDPFRRDYVEYVDEEGTHLMFEAELNELLKWYNLTYDCDECILVNRGDYAYRPFIELNYRLKAEAPNKVIKQTAKLKLNSSYGKLAERSERGTAHYEISQDTGAVHLVQDGTETDTSGMLNVIVGAKVTSYARCYILSMIRTVCTNIAKQFVYIDTDSIHCFAEYDGADPTRLGALKLEARCEAVKYIAPKTYIDIEHVNADGSVSIEAIEAHTKGINVSAVNKHFKGLNNLTLREIDKAIDYGVKYTVLAALNVVGGKVLVPTNKYLARPELAPNTVINTGYTGYINEL